MMNLQEEMLKIKNEMIDEFDKRVEALKVDEQEFPQDGEDYWLISSEGCVTYTMFTDNHVDLGRKEVGNVFRTKEQAEFALEKLKVEAELRKYSTPFKEDENNCFIQINSSYNNIVIDTDEGYQTQGTIYYETRKEALLAIDTVGEDRIKKYIFGVEDWK